MQGAKSDKLKQVGKSVVVMGFNVPLLASKQQGVNKQ